MILSGGGTPYSNHYSQYLQTQTLADHLSLRFGDKAVTVRFGAGNDEQRPKLLADVHKTTKSEGDGLSLHDLRFGVIKGNAPATEANARAYFEALPPKGNLFLFVSDHGYSQDGDTNNCIELWSYDPVSMRRGPEDERCLSKNELKKILDTRPKATTVFQMSQCYSGGFHQLSVTSHKGYPAANPAICGFTAVTEDATASGCTPDVDGPGYKGYERFFTQQLTGRDVVTGKVLRKPKATMREAHFAAALEDTTKDIPLTTSDYYLREWARKILGETFKPRAGTLDAAKVKRVYGDVVDGRGAFGGDAAQGRVIAAAGELGPSVAEKYLYLDATIKMLVAHDPTLRPHLAGAGAEIRAEIDATNTKLNERGAVADGLDKDLAALRHDDVFGPWYDAVNAGPVAQLSEQERQSYELGRFAELEQENAGATGVASWLDGVCILQLAEKVTKDPADAPALARYCATRDEKMRAFAGAAGVELSAKENELTALYDELATLQQRRDHLRRVLIIHQTIAASVALAAMGDAKAIRETLDLITCEATRFQE